MILHCCFAGCDPQPCGCCIRMAGHDENCAQKVGQSPVKRLTPPPSAITVDMLLEWLQIASDEGHGSLPVVIAYEAQRGQRAIEKPSSIHLDNHSRPVEQKPQYTRVIISAPIRG